MTKIEQLKARLVELSETGKAIQAKADAENRDLTAEEVTELDLITNEFETKEADIARRELVAEQEGRLTASAGRITNAAKPSAKPGLDTDSTVIVPTNRKANREAPSTQEERQRWGFRNLGDFCLAVRSAQQNPSAMDARLIQNALTTYGSEGVGADGGFAVPPEWRSEIMQLITGEGSLLAQTDQQNATGNSITFPVDETTAWQTTGGIQAYWDSEAAAMTQSKPLLKDLQVKLSRLTALVPVTDELLEDANALSGYVAAKAGDKLNFKVTDALVNGTGVGQPLGIQNAPCTVTVSKESSQTATTIHAFNIVKMMARLPAQSFARSTWLINQDCVPQILSLGFPVTTASGTGVGAGALYLPPNGLANSSPYGSLLGRPIFVTEACASLGTLGDIILCDLTKYLTVVKAGGVKSDVSIHLFFDQNATAFRFVLRMNGQPWLSAPITRKNGSNTLSHFVNLQAR